MANENDQLVSTTAAKSADGTKSAQISTWFLNWRLPKNAFWQVGVFRIVVLIELLFFLLITISMILYPGGTKADHNRQGYSFFTNFLSDLGESVALNGQPNTASMVLFLLAMTLAGIATLLFSLAFTQLFVLTRRSIWFSHIGALLGVIAGICLIGVGIVPENIASGLHNFCIYAGLLIFVAAYIFFFQAMVRTKGLAKRISWVYYVLGVVFIVYTIISSWVTLFGPAPDTLAWVVIQATGQKIIVYAALLGLLIESLLLPSVLSKGEYPH